MFISSNLAVNAVQMEKYMLSCRICDNALISMRMNILNSLPRGNLVDGLPRAASTLNNFMAEIGN